MPGVPAPIPLDGHPLTPEIQIPPSYCDPWLLRTQLEFFVASPAVASSAWLNSWNSMSSVTLMLPAIQKVLTLCALILSSPLASLQAQQLVRHSVD